MQDQDCEEKHLVWFALQGSMEEPKPEEQFLQCARNGDLPGVERLLNSKARAETRIDINCKGMPATPGFYESEHLNMVRGPEVGLRWFPSGSQHS